MNNLTFDMYTDGGCIGKNPSPHGGTWSWVWVNSKTGKRLNCDSGIILPRGIGKSNVTNNVAELYAALIALQSVPAGWRGILWTDSKVTKYRLTTSNRFNGAPKTLQEQCLNLRCNRTWSVLLCGGHPRKSDLEVGYDRRGLPVSRHNVFVDQLCRKQAQRFMKRLENA